MTDVTHMVINKNALVSILLNNEILRYIVRLIMIHGFDDLRILSQFDSISFK